MTGQQFIREVIGTGTESCTKCNRNYPDLCTWHDARANEFDELLTKARLEGEANSLRLMREIPDADPRYYAMIDDRLAELEAMQ